MQEYLECDRYFTSPPFVVLTVDQFVEHFQMRELMMQNSSFHS